MAKDYAKSKNSKKKSGASRSSQRSPLSIQLIIASLLIMGAMVAFLIYLKTEQTLTKTQTQSPSKTVGKTKIANKTLSLKNNDADNKTNELENDFNEVPFYRTHEEMLNKTVEIPIEDLKLSNDGREYIYIMPCGSFRENKRAEELKAQIAMAGYESKINPIKVKSGLWHRVELGPYNSKRKTESIRHRLQDNGINYCKIWPKKIN